jgi:murein DD-endopeptidase MepM/ murein hydrolase activator NlpD
MTIQNARLRALYAGVLAALCLLAQSAPAAADDSTPAPPRAAPLARTFPRTFGSYDALLATASEAANDQVTLYAQLLIAQAQGGTAKSLLSAVTDPRIRGGLVRTETNVSDEPALVALRMKVASAEQTVTQAIASGAATAAPPSTWQRPLAGEISQPFGQTSLGLEPARLDKGLLYMHFHEGVDIVARAGTPVVAPARGRVVFAGLMADGAEVVVLAHDNGLVSLYAHLEAGPLAPTVTAGDIVQAGDPIGAVGLTGLTTGFHLHWAVYKNGEPQDPLSTLGG